MAKECNANCASAAFERQGQADTSAHRRKRIPANRHAPLQFDLASVSNIRVPRATRTVLDDIERLAALLDSQDRRAVPIAITRRQQQELTTLRPGDRTLMWREHPLRVVSD